MNLREVQEILEAEVIVGNDLESFEVEMVCGADLMSDVLAHTKADCMLLTGLANPQAVRTAEIANIKAICLVRGKLPFPETIALAQEKGLPMLATKLPMFESCGRLYCKGFKGCSDRGV